ncbi:MAG: hypothetical protein ACRYFX_19400 [Janthinobacterium lividum]
MIEYLPYLFGGTRLLLGAVILVKTLGLFGSEAKPDSFFEKHKTVSVCLGGFLLLSGLYTIFFSSADSYKI